MKLPIYLDYAATTPIDVKVATEMARFMTQDGNFANAASQHALGQQAALAVENARLNVADLINAEADEIIWTSGATEADNLAIKGAAHLYKKKGKHIITMTTEHKAVLDSMQQLEKEGYDISYLAPEKNGTLDLNKLEQAIRPDTVLLSIMHVNNELGIINDLASIGEIAAKKEILFHSDAAQSAGKIAIDVRKFNVDLMSLSAHKIYGPKGIGVLFIRKRPRVRVEAQIHGGGHERGLRSGTLPVHQIVGMGEAFLLAKKSMTKDQAHIAKLRDKFIREIGSLPGIKINVPLELCIPNIVNVQFDVADAEDFINAITDLAISTGSACTANEQGPSYVLRALGLNEQQAGNSIRFSFGKFTTSEDIDYALAYMKKKLA